MARPIPREPPVTRTVGWGTGEDEGEIPASDDVGMRASRAVLSLNARHKGKLSGRARRGTPAGQRADAACVRLPPKRAGRRGGQVPRSGLAALQELCYGGDHLVQDRSAGGTTVQRVRVHVGVIGFVGLSLTLGPGLHDPGSAAPRAETVANADDYFPDSMGSRWRYR